MRIRAAGNQIQTAGLQDLAHFLRIFNHLCRIVLKLRREIFSETNCLGGNHMHQRAALSSRENRRIDFFCNIFIVSQNHAAAGTAQSLVRRCCYHIGIFQRIRMDAAGNQTGKMRHIHHQISSDFIGNFPKTLKINPPRISRPARDNQFGLVFQSQALNPVIINQPGLFTNAVLNRLQPFSRKRNL